MAPAMQTRAQERAASSEPSSSQPVGNKRRARTYSPDIDLADDASQTTARPTQRKRRKSTKTTVTTIASNSSASSHPELVTVQEEETIVVATGDHDSVIDDQPSTPVMTEAAIDRRATLPATAIAIDSPMQEKDHGRKSLPADLSFDAFVEEHPVMTPLKTLMKRHIDRLHTESGINTRKASPKANRPDMLYYDPANGPLPALSNEYLVVTNVTAANSTTQVLEISKEEQERLSFTTAIERLSVELAQNKSSLELLLIELRAMGFTHEQSDSAPEILHSIRTTFAAIRQRVENIVPDSNRVLETVLLANIVDQLDTFAAEVVFKDREIARKDDFEEHLLGQIDDLIGRLAEAELLREKLEASIRQHAKNGEEDTRYIKEIDDKLADIEIQHGRVAGLLQEKINEITALKGNNNDLAQTCEQFQLKLTAYAEKEAELEDQIVLMETNFNAAIEKLQHDHALEQESLASLAEKEKSDRLAALQTVNDYADTIKDLEEQIAQGKLAVKKFQEALSASTEALAEEQASYNDMVSKNDSLSKTNEELTRSLELAQATLESTEDKLSKVQQLTDSERRQRQTAEEGLDTAQGQIEELNNKLHQQGIEANQLRQKLFEVQQTTQKKIDALEDTIAQRSEVFENDLAAESDRRDVAEQLAEERQNMIEQLEGDLNGIETAMEKTLGEKEALLHQIEERAADLEEKLAGVQAKLKTRTTEHAALHKSSTKRIVTLEQDVENVKNQLWATTANLETVQAQSQQQQQQMIDALAVRDATIEDLKDDAADSTERIRVLEVERTSLERRIEDEAENMLLCQEKNADEVAGFRAIIHDKQAQLEALALRAAESDSALKVLITSKESHVNELQTILEERDIRITELMAGNQELANLLEALAKRTVSDTRDMLFQQEEALTKNKQYQAVIGAAAEYAAVRAEELRVSEMDKVDEHQEVVSVTTTTKKTRKTTFRDSGVAVE